MAAAAPQEGLDEKNRVCFFKLLLLISFLKIITS